jgi:hypothetical protein
MALLPGIDSLAFLEPLIRATIGPADYQFGPRSFASA